MPTGSADLGDVGRPERRDRAASTNDHPNDLALVDLPRGPSD